jgi:hypothetical protein
MAVTDGMVDELASFVRTERICCDFFIFNLSISGDNSQVWLEITGPKGAKEFIKAELELNKTRHIRNVIFEKWRCLPLIFKYKHFTISAS